ncbi:MAG: GNAT family N-acetyltransferase [Gammaproteobacteria bacterium]
MEVKVFDSISEIPPSIARQFSFPTVEDFFLSLNWFACLYDTSLHSTMTPRIYCLIDNDHRPVGMIFCATKKGERTLYSLTNFYTMKFGLTSLANVSSTPQPSDRLVEYIQSERPRWNAIDFRFMVANDLSNSDIQRALEQNGFSVSTYFMYENWHVNMLGKDFDAYYSSLSSRLRNTIKRKEKKLNKSHLPQIRIHVNNDLELEQATKDYVSIYNKSWKRPEPFPDFIPRLVLTSSKLGILRLGLLYIDDKPAAAQLWIVTNKEALIYKLAYDEEFSSFSPGSILSREMFRYVVDIDKIKEINYGVGSENYKKDWMSSVRKIDGMQAYNKKTIAGLSLSTFRSIKTMFKPEKETSL